MDNEKNIDFSILEIGYKKIEFPIIIFAQMFNFNFYHIFDYHH